MTLELTLPSELEQRLRTEADRQGVSADACALQLLERHLPDDNRHAQTAAMLQSWIDAPDDDDGDPSYDLYRALDEARTSDRKLFPPELKGVSW